MKKNIGTIVLSVVSSISGQAQDFRTVQTKDLKFEIFNAGEDSFGIASVLVSGKENAILFDAQFTRDNAEKVAQHILKSGKNLQEIFITYGDPDFYFGLEVFKKYFPNVVAYTTPKVYDHILETAQGKVEYWGGILGDAIAKNVVLPQVYTKGEIELEGHKLQILDLQKFPDRTFIWVPDTKTVLGGINVFGDTFHLWTADTKSKESKDNWIEILKTIEALNPEVVIPGHANAESSLDIKSVKYTIKYLQDYQKAIDKSKDSKELIEIMKKEYPNAKFETGLQLGAPVNKNEVNW